MVVKRDIWSKRDVTIFGKCFAASSEQKKNEAVVTEKEARKKRKKKALLEKPFMV